MEKRPTKKQKELLNFISEFITSNGYGPSYREVMRALDYKSVSTVATHINGLIVRGWLVKRDNSARSLEVRGMAQQAPVSMMESGVSARTEIEQKIAELGKSGDATDEIAILQQAVRILYPQS